MKSFASLLFILCFCLSITAQERDSILVQDVEKLKKNVNSLKTSQKKLNSKLVSASKKQSTALEETSSAVAQNQKDIEEANARTSELGQRMDQKLAEANDSRTSLADWTRQMITILALVFLALLIVLLVLIITNRSRTSKAFRKLEAKLDNTKETLETEIRDVLSRHEEDLAALRSDIDKNKK